MKPLNSSESFETLVILVTVVVGFIGSVILFFLEIPPIFSSIFLATGIAALVYGFLGGIQDSTLVVGTIKITGTLAALMACAIIINRVVEDQIETKLKREKEASQIDLNVDCDPYPQTWFVMDKNKQIPVEVTIKGVKHGEIRKPDNDIWEKKSLRLKRDGRRIEVYPESDDNQEPDQDFQLGYLSRDALHKAKLFSRIGKEVHNFVTTIELYSGDSDDLLMSFPFILKTDTYSQSYSKYELKKKNADEVIVEGKIKERGANVHKIDDKYYLISVIKVNHELREKSYAKFAVGELRTR